MTDADDVLARAEDRAAALAAGDADALAGLLHPQFCWTSHTGMHFYRSTYVRANTGGSTVWLSQELVEPEVVVVGDTAVLTCVVADRVRPGDAGAEQFRMPMTQVWVRDAHGWTCLAGHAGPRIDSDDPVRA